MAPYNGSSTDYSNGSYVGGSTFITGTTSYMPYSHTHSMYSGSAMVELTPAQKKEREVQNKKLAEALRRQRQKEWDEWHLGKLSDWKKLKIMKITRGLLNQYHREQEVKKLMSGIKWLLFFLGLAVLINFGRILDLIKFAIK